MKVTYNWLREYVDFDWTPEELAERLTMLGVEVEGVERAGGGLEGIVVGQVLTREQHPNADRLTLCTVNDGEGERSIVCGATNFQAGDKVALALPGTEMPVPEGEKPFTIKVGKIRGERSEGMMCSGKELMLSDDAEGILILPGDAMVGQPFAEHLGRSREDRVYDLEITPNRPDLNGVIGLAREIAALTGNPLKLPDTNFQEGTERAENLVEVRIEDASLCPRYNARVIRGVRVGPSPDWLREALDKVGVRSINNVVDVTNYVMLESGQPLHAFDLHLLAKAGGRPTVVIRQATEGEVFTTLDEQEHELGSERLLIADETKGIALAGVMGGLNTEIGEGTEDVLLECACFQPQNIRATSKALGLSTDASYRFERGADVGVTDWASRRAARLIVDVAGGELAAGVVDAWPEPAEPIEITLRHERANTLLGVELNPAESIAHLRGLGMEVVAESNESVTVRVPTWRVDLKRETDLIEEVCRLHGVDRIPATPPRGARGENKFDAIHDVLSCLRQWLAAQGLSEAQGQTLIRADEAERAESDMVSLERPLSSDMNVLRPSLLPGLLDSLKQNATHGSHDVGLFEIGRVFRAKEKSVCEGRRLAITMTGRRDPTHWEGAGREETVGMPDLLGVLEVVLSELGVHGVSRARRGKETGLFVESAALVLGKKEIGELGQLLPTLARDYELRGTVLMAELNLDLLLQRRSTGHAFKVLPQFPAIERDVAMLVPEGVIHERVLEVVRQANPEHLSRTNLFDVFRGKNIPLGKKSMAYAFTYRHGERTLTDQEVNGAHEKLVAALYRELGAEIRD